MCQPSTASCLPIRSRAGSTSCKPPDAHCGNIARQETTATSSYRSLSLSGTDFDSFAETTAFRQVAQTITALSTQDERIAEEFRLIEAGRVSKGKIVEIEGDVPVGMKMKLGDFAEAISTRVWESVGRANWRRFEEARAFVHGLGLKSQTEWYGLLQVRQEAQDIPAGPWRVYAKPVGQDMGDWLGHWHHCDFGSPIPTFQEGTRSTYANLGLKSAVGVVSTIAKSGREGRGRIPTNPHIVYAEEGWAGIGDWLGTGCGCSPLAEFRPFKKARTFVHVSD